MDNLIFVHEEKLKILEEQSLFFFAFLPDNESHQKPHAHTRSKISFLFKKKDKRL